MNGKERKVHYQGHIILRALFTTHMGIPIIFRQVALCPMTRQSRGRQLSARVVKLSIAQGMADLIVRR